MAENFLKLNIKKTQFLLCGSPKTLSFYESRFDEIYRVLKLEEGNGNGLDKTLGVVIDKHLGFREMITETCKSSYYKLNKLQNMQSSLDEGTRLTLVKCFII